MNPFQWLQIRDENNKKEVKHIDPETWFHRWLRIMLMVMAFGFLILGLGTLLV